MLKLLQEEMPSNTWIVKDSTKSLLFDCKEISLPLNQEDELAMEKMIDWVRVSQNETLNSSQHLIEAIGIAAPQIGYNSNMYYILLPLVNEDGKINYIEHALINPKISGKSKQLTALKNGEGCLSVDKKHEGLVPRSYKVQVSGYDFLKKEYVNLIARGYEAIVFQHEQDHLEKKLYYHYINQKDPWFKTENLIII